MDKMYRPVGTGATVNEAAILRGGAIPFPLGPHVKASANMSHHKKIGSASNWTRKMGGQHAGSGVHVHDTTRRYNRRTPGGVNAHKTVYNSL